MASNKRTLLDNYARERGSIIVGGQAVAKSVSVHGPVPLPAHLPPGRALRPADRLLLLLRRRAVRPRARRRRPALRRRRPLFVRRDHRPHHRPQDLGRDDRADDRPQGAAGRRPGARRQQAAPSSRSTRRPARSWPWSATRRTTRTRCRATTSSKAAKALAEPVHRQGQGLPQPRHQRRLYPPGSTFKVVTAAAALENGVVSDEQLRGARARRSSTCR